MREIHQYKDSLIAITDEGPLGFADGTYILSSHKAIWAIFHSQGEMVVSGFDGLQCIADKESALQATKELIDQHRNDMAEREEAYREKKTAAEIALLAPPEQQETQLFHGANLTIPVELLIALHNASPQGSAARRDAIAYVEDSAKKQSNASWTLGLRMLPSGDLFFSDAAYTSAVYRAKQEVRTKGVMDLFSKLSSELDLVRVFHNHELAASTHVAGELGEPLIEVKDCSTQLTQLRDKLTALQSNFNHQDGTGQITTELGHNTDTDTRVLTVTQGPTALESLRRTVKVGQ